MAKQATVKLSLTERLRDSRRQTTSMALPLAVHHRLDVLAGLAADVNASRAEIIGMLIAECELDADQLERLVLVYRKKTVGDVIPPLPGQHHDVRNRNNVIELQVRKPGRPPNRAAG